MTPRSSRSSPSVRTEKGVELFLAEIGHLHLSSSESRRGAGPLEAYERAGVPAPGSLDGGPWLSVPLAWLAPWVAIPANKPFLA
jgi:hypothetical protein